MVARRAKAVERSLKGGYSLGNLFGSDEQVVPKRVRVNRGKYDKVRAQSAKRLQEKRLNLQIG